MGKEINVIELLSSSLNQRDEKANIELAEKVVKSNDSKAIQSLVDLLVHKDRKIQNNSIKVLYEIGDRNPKLIAKHYNVFMELLHSKNNRLQWGGMIALGYIIGERPKEVYDKLGEILEAADKGSVITKDHAINILISLCSVKKYSSDAFTLLMEQLLKAPVNQFPMYAERSKAIINDKNKMEFLIVLNQRLDDMDKESRRKRVEKVIRSISSL